MFGGDKNAQVAMYLEKLLELFSGLPDKDEAAPAEGKVDAIVVDAKPVDEEKAKAVC